MTLFCMAGYIMLNFISIVVCQTGINRKSYGNCVEFLFTTIVHPQPAFPNSPTPPFLITQYLCLYILVMCNTFARMQKCKSAGFENMRAQMVIYMQYENSKRDANGQKISTLSIVQLSTIAQYISNCNMEYGIYE